MRHTDEIEAMRALEAAMADPDVAERVAVRLALREPCARLYSPSCVVVWDHTLRREETGWCSTWPGPWQCTTGLRCGYPMGSVWDGAGSTCAPAIA